jgi:hypothetical protein
MYLCVASYIMYVFVASYIMYLFVFVASYIMYLCLWLVTSCICVCGSLHHAFVFVASYIMYLCLWLVTSCILPYVPVLSPQLAFWLFSEHLHNTENGTELNYDAESALTLNSLCPRSSVLCCSANWIEMNSTSDVFRKKSLSLTYYCNKYTRCVAVACGDIFTTVTPSDFFDTIWIENKTIPESTPSNLMFFQTFRTVCHLILNGLSSRSERSVISFRTVCHLVLNGLSSHSERSVISFRKVCHLAQNGLSSHSEWSVISSRTVCHLIQNGLSSHSEQQMVNEAGLLQAKKQQYAHANATERNYLSWWLIE